MKRKIIIPNNKKQKLVGYLYPKKSQTLLIVCHGLVSFNDVPEAIIFLEKYSEACSIFSFDFTGNGESDGYDKYRMEQEVADIGSVISFFKKDYKNIVLYGVSHGGSAVAVATTTYKEIKGLILVNAAFNIWQTNPSILIYSLLSKVHRESLRYLKKNLKPEKIRVPVLIIYGEKDNIVRPIQSLNFFKKIHTKKELFMIPNGDHALADKKYLPYTPIVTNWISKTFPEQ